MSTHTHVAGAPKLGLTKGGGEITRMTVDMPPQGQLTPGGRRFYYGVFRVFLTIFLPVYRRPGRRPWPFTQIGRLLPNSSVAV